MKMNYALAGRYTAACLFGIVLGGLVVRQVTPKPAPMPSTPTAPHTRAEEVVSTKREQALILMETATINHELSENDFTLLTIFLNSDNALLIEYGLGTGMLLTANVEQRDYVVLVAKRLIEHQDGRIRAQALITLWKLDQPAFHDAAWKLVNDKDEFVMQAREELTMRLRGQK